MKQRISLKQRMYQVGQHLKEKWDIYVSVSIAILTAIFRILGLATDTVVLASILALLAFLAVNILRNRWTDEKLQDTIKQLEAHLPLESELAIYATQEEAEDFLKRRIAAHPPHDAVVIQYSVSTDLLKKLIETNANVKVFMQHEDTATKIGSRQQAFNIQTAFEAVSVSLPRPLARYPVEIYKYYTPGTINGIRIDDEILCMSWYVYEQADDDNRFKLMRQFTDDAILVFNHNRVAVVAEKGYKGFDALDKTFRVLEEHYRSNGLCVLPKKEVTPSPTATSPSNSIIDSNLVDQEHTSSTNEKQQ